MSFRLRLALLFVTTLVAVGRVKALLEGQVTTVAPARVTSPTSEPSSHGAWASSERALSSPCAASHST